jgi:hypothetical protein
LGCVPVGFNLYALGAGRLSNLNLPLLLDCAMLLVEGGQIGGTGHDSGRKFIAGFSCNLDLSATLG